MRVRGNTGSPLSAASPPLPALLSPRHIPELSTRLRVHTTAPTSQTQTKVSIYNL